MTTRVLAWACWGAIALTVGGGVLAATRARPTAPIVPRAAWGTPRIAPRLSGDSLAQLTARIVATDLFRVDRHPAAVAYRPGALTAVGAAPAPVPKPNLAVAGIVGPPWAAVLTGVPGHPTSVVVHPGDTLGGLRVRRITATAVTVTGVDTLWRLTVQQPWH